MRFRGDDFEQPLEVELWPEDRGGGADVSFGRTPRQSPERRGRRPARWWIGGAAVAALVGGAIAIGQGGADESAPDSTLATIAATTTDAGPGPTRVRAVTSTTTTVYTPPAALATDPGWDIYLTDGGEGLRQFDPVTGVITPAEGPSSAYAVVAGPGGPQYLWFGLLGTSGPVASVGDGTGWGIEGTDVVRVSLDDGSELERVPLAGRVIVDQTYLVGTSALGRPVVVLADARSYEITAEGAFRRFADGLVAMGVDRGRYAETMCDEAGACLLALRGAVATLEIPVVGLSSVAFSPDGSHAVTYEYGRNGLVVKVYDLTVGEVLSVEPGGNFGFYGPNTVGWSPDGRFFAFVGGRDLRLLDVSTGEVIELDDDLAPNLQIAGVA